MCQRCQKGGLLCDGPKDTTFVKATIVKSRRSQKGDLTCTKKESQELVLNPNTQTSMTTHDLIPKLYEYEVYICYMRKHLFANGPIDLRLQDLQIADFVGTDSSKPVVADMPVFNQALLSFSTVFFASKNHQPHALAQGYAMHGVALQALNRKLSTPGCHINDDVVVSVITLAMLESMVPSGPNNYLKHMLGLEQLLSLRDPASLANSSYRTLEMYKGIRHFILFASLRNRSPSILAKPEWKAVLRTNLSLEEPEEQDLHDVLADCSVLIAARDGLAVHRGRMNSQSVQRQNEIQGRAMELLLYLNTWKQCWDANVQNMYAEEDDAQICTLPQAPTIYRFDNAAIVRIFMLYHTALIHVLEILASPTSPLSKSTYDWTATSFCDIWTSIEEENYDTAKHLASLEIARCIPDYLAHLGARERNRFVSPVVQWAFSTALKAAGGAHSIEGEWMVGLLDATGSQVFAKGAWES